MCVDNGRGGTGPRHFGDCTTTLIERCLAHFTPSACISADADDRASMYQHAANLLAWLYARRHPVRVAVDDVWMFKGMLALACPDAVRELDSDMRHGHIGYDVVISWTPAELACHPVVIACRDSVADGATMSGPRLPEELVVFYVASRW